MADEADQTADRMEREEALRRRFVPKEEIPACGVCYYCGEDVGPSKKFCDSSHSEAWEFERRMKRLGK